MTVTPKLKPAEGLFCCKGVARPCFLAKVWLGLGSCFGAANTVNGRISAFAHNSICAVPEPANTVTSGISVSSDAANTVTSSISEFAEAEAANTINSSSSAFSEAANMVSSRISEVGKAAHDGG